MIEFTIKQQQFSEALFYLNQITKKIKTTPYLHYKCVQFLVKNEELILYSCDGSQLCEIKMGKFSGIENFSKMVELFSINDVVQLSKSDNIKLTFKDKQLIVSDDTGEYKVPYGEDHDFSYIVTSAGVDYLNCKLLDVEPQYLKEILMFLSACLPIRGEYTQYRGVYFDGNFVTTNALSCAVYKYGDAIKEPIFI